MTDLAITFTPPSVEDLRDLFPGYTVEGFIAGGGMGAVYRATQKSLDRAVAIKILPQELRMMRDTWPLLNKRPRRWPR